MPWRAEPGQTPNPYHVLLSEAMLQQTQVATVVPYFRRFIDAFPTIQSLAQADEQQILRLWQGLGYYSRARNLLKAARLIVERFDGQIPRTVDDLLTLPGVGRYTAGAIASIAYDTPAPIVDGNVVRILCRIDAVTDDPRSRDVLARIWARAAQLVPPKRPGDFNQAMMELGATLCTPKSPKCLVCPVERLCRARAAGIAEQIPPPKPSKPLPIERRLVICIQNPHGQYLIEQRPPTGRWAGLWQFVTLTTPTLPPTARSLSTRLNLPVTDLKPLTPVRHTLTHRQYHFDVLSARTTSADTVAPRVWASLPDLDNFPFSKPHLTIRGQLSI
jgi:A/G-specific adenine glycosylase